MKTENRVFVRALALGIVGSFFFAFNFILIRSMNLGGGYYLWTACLRYFFTLPLMALLFGKAIPVKNLLLSLLIVAGILLMQLSKLRAGVQADWPMPLLTMGVAAFSYPLGNRKMMQTVSGEVLSTPQRVFGMTLCSMPFWLLCAARAYAQAGLPTASQCFQSFLIALLAGVVATVLFFAATDLVKDNQKQLAVVEATQAGEVLFTVLMGVLLLKDSAPDAMGFAGLGILVLGMILNSIV